MTRSKKKSLPEAGAAFVYRLADGRYGVCRVLRQSHGNDRWLGGLAVLVATSAWIGKKSPAPTDPALRPILHVTRHNPKGVIELTWINDPVPRGFKTLGVIPPTNEERKMKCSALSGWETCPIMLLGQWRWENDRKALLADEALEAKKEAEALAARFNEIDRTRKSITLEQLSRRRFFANWKHMPPKEAIRASRETMKKAVKAMIALGPSSTKAKRKKVLKECIEDFNKLDRTMNRFIETSERDDICTEFDLLVHACGLGDLDSLADEWRDW
ncbi:MAG: hypothetical protein FJ308_16180 [Planctomycetes bacterium]|nr:hypothetical protein [Planctomycetota bacterium]